MGSRVLGWIATVGPLGKIRIAPGTFGTLAGIPLALILGQLTPPFSVPALFCFCVLGWLSAREKVRMLGTNDPKEVVVDEVAGFLVASWFLPQSWVSLALAFFAFRFYDILKPFPANFFDQKVHGGLGVVMDDLIAGIYANLTVRILLWSKTLLS